MRARWPRSSTMAGILSWGLPGWSVRFVRGSHPSSEGRYRRLFSLRLREVRAVHSPMASGRVESELQERSRETRFEASRPNSCSGMLVSLFDDRSSEICSFGDNARTCKRSREMMSVCMIQITHAYTDDGEVQTPSSHAEHSPLMVPL